MRQPRRDTVRAMVSQVVGRWSADSVVAPQAAGCQPVTLGGLLLLGFAGALDSLTVMGTR